MTAPINASPTERLLDTSAQAITAGFAAADLAAQGDMIPEEALKICREQLERIALAGRLFRGEILRQAMRREERNLERHRKQLAQEIRAEVGATGAPA